MKSIIFMSDLYHFLLSCEENRHQILANNVGMDRQKKYSFSSFIFYLLIFQLLNYIIHLMAINYKLAKSITRPFHVVIG